MHTAHVALAACTALTLLLSSAPVIAQESPAAKRMELRITSGAFVPTGTQRRALADAHVSAAQLSWAIRSSLAITGTFGWARSRDLGSSDSPKLDVFSSDIGIEARHANRPARRAAFLGLGAGMRSYNHRSLAVDATNNLAAYAAAGGELGIGRVGLRLEVRDYVAGFKPLVGIGESATRNDIVVMGALRFDLKRSAQR